MVVETLAVVARLHLERLVHQNVTDRHIMWCEEAGGAMVLNFEKVVGSEEVW